MLISKNKQLRGGSDGMSLLEVLLAVAVFTVGIGTVAHLFVGSYYSSIHSVEKNQALLIAKEGVEAVRSMKDDDFENVEERTEDGIEINGGVWAFKSGADVIDDKYTREIDVAEIDSGTWEVTVTVSWQPLRGEESEVRIIEQMTAWRESFVFDLPVTEGLVLRLDASAVEELSDGDKVETWDDLSGEENDATQATEENRPIYKTDILNGKPVVRFDGENDYLTTGAANIGQSHTIFAVAQSQEEDAPHRRQLIQSGGSTIGNDNVIIEQENDENNWRAFVYSSEESSGVIDLQSKNSVITGQWYLISYIRDDDTKESKLWINENLEDDDVWDGTVSGETEELFIGQHTSLDFHWWGDVAEILIYNTALSDSDRGKVEQYLGEKWGIDE